MCLMFQTLFTCDSLGNNAPSKSRCTAVQLNRQAHRVPSCAAASLGRCEPLAKRSGASKEKFFLADCQLPNRSCAASRDQSPQSEGDDSVHNEGIDPDR